MTVRQPRPGPLAGVPLGAARTGGFSLVMVSILLTVAAIILVSLLPGKETGDYNQKVLASETKLDKVEEAMRGFMALNGRLPCPADGQYAIGTANFGVEAANPGTCTGAIAVKDASGGIKDNVMHLFISHGATGHGAWPINGSTAANRINAGITDADMLANASVNSSFTLTAGYQFVQKEKTSTFDDLVYVSPSIRNTCCEGINCVPLGFRVDGTVAHVNEGFVVATGDVNGDGIPDLILAGYDGNGSQIYVVFGTAQGFPNPLPLNSLNGSNGFIFQAGGGTGQFVAVGDVNHDGIADIVTLGNWFEAYVLFGHSGAWPAVVKTSTWTRGTDGAELYVPGGHLENAAVGDVNGDGIDDLILANPDSDSSNGRIYVLFGHAGPWQSTAQDISTVNGTTGFYMTGVQGTGYLGLFGLAAADLNGDGTKDILAVENQHYSSTIQARLYVVYGQKPWPSGTASLSLGSLNGTNGYAITYATDGYDFGGKLAVADVNNDGKPDTVIACYDCGHTGSVYVIFGQAAAWPATSDVDTLVAGGQGIRIDGPSRSFLGNGLAVGDINGDGIPDILMGGPDDNFGNPADFDHAYVLFGHSGAWSSRNLSTTPLTGTDGFKLDCPSLVYWSGVYGCGWGVAIADMNGDGRNDIIVSDMSATSQGNSQAGWTYVLYGKAAAWTAEYSLGNVYNGQ